MLYIDGIVITIFLAVLLTGKKNKTPADGLLILWLIVIALHLFLFYFLISGKIYDYPFLMGIQIPFPLLHGPFLFLYTVALTSHQTKFSLVWLIHFIPVVILYSFLIPFFGLSAAEKITVYRNSGAGHETLMTFSLIAIILSGIAYVTASLIRLRRYRKAIENEFSDIEKIILAWLRYLVYGIAVIWIAVIFGNDSIVFSIAVVFVFFLGFFGIRQIGIFTSSNLPAKVLQPLASGSRSNEFFTTIRQEPSNENFVREDSNSISTKVKYEKSGLAEDQAGRIYERLMKVMTDQKLFTEPELTLAGLAKTLGVHPNHLSQVINSYEGKNFYDYINFHRVEEFRKLAPHPGNKNYTLLSMAFECGFNSKTSFNRNFRKVTGISPSEYLEQQHITLE